MTQSSGKTFRFAQTAERTRDGEDENVHRLSYTIVNRKLGSNLKQNKHPTRGLRKEAEGPFGVTGVGALRGSQHLPELGVSSKHGYQRGGTGCKATGTSFQMQGND